MTRTKLTAIGEQVGVILPSDAIETLKAGGAEEIAVINTPHGVILQRVDAETAQQIEIAVDVMDRRRDALKRLAQ